MDRQQLLRKQAHRRALSDPRQATRIRLPRTRGMDHWIVPSSTYPGECYLIVASHDDDGNYISSHCNCQAGGFGRVCVHVAIVERRLIADGLLDDPLDESDPDRLRPEGMTSLEFINGAR